MHKEVLDEVQNQQQFWDICEEIYFRQIQNIEMVKSLLLTLLVIALTQSMTINHCPLCNSHMVVLESSLFELSFDYVLPENIPLGGSEVEVLWNGNNHGLLKPTDRNIHHFTTELRILPYPNTLLFKVKDKTQELIVDNVTLVRRGNTDNIVQNGNFETPVKNIKFFDSTFLGWKGFPKSVDCNQLNKNCFSTAALIGSGARSSLSQEFEFDIESRFNTDKYTLYFDYAAESGAPLSSSQGSVTWNQQVLDINPGDYEIHSVKIPLKPIPNQINTLSFQGLGKADGFGLTISNVKLISLGNSANMIINGDFSIPQISHKSETISYLPGWDLSSQTATLKKSVISNPLWPRNIQQVLTLDDGKNIAVAQQFKIEKKFKYSPKDVPFFEVSFEYAANDDQYLSNSKGQILFNGNIMAEFSPENRKVQTFTQTMSFVPSANKFTFRAKKGSSYAISNFRVIRLGLKDNLVINGDFQTTKQEGLIPGWTGHAFILDSEDFNQNWKDTKVAKISDKDGDTLSQSFILDNNFRYRTNRYHLSLQMAATEDAKLNAPLAEVSWNGKIYPLSVSSQKVQTFKVDVVAVKGSNLITISGQGIDGEGLTIDNVKLTPFGSSAVCLKNGDFEGREIKGKGLNKKVFYEIPDWEGHDVEITFNDQYNENWPESNDQILALVSNKKTIISQVLTLTEDDTIGVEEPNVFTLSFKYAAEDGKPLQQTGGEVYWNKKLVGEFVPTSWNITDYTLNIKVDTGVNTLLIKAAGGLEAYGLTIDDVKLVRQGSDDNLIDNGQFNKPAVPGWNVVHNAPLLNHLWSTTTVGRLDPNNNLTLTKNFEFDEYYRFKTNKLHLLVDFVAKKGSSLSTIGGTVRWNNLVEHMAPRDTKVQTLRIPVLAQQGQNKISFQGQGITIDNVKLIPLGSVSNVLLNGDFQIPVVDSKIQKIAPSGWNGYQGIQFGQSFLFSPEWNDQNGQVVGLTKRGSFLTQTVILDSTKAIRQPQFPFFTLSFDYEATEQGQNIVGEVLWNNRLVSILKDETNINTLKVRVDAVHGRNSLLIKPKNQGVVVTNVRLSRFGLDESIIQNGHFRAVKIGSKIPYWNGDASIEDASQYADQWEGKVAVLDDKDDYVEQTINFDGGLRYITPDFVVSFQYGVREGVKFDSAKARAFWNNQLFTFTPQDYELHVFKRVLRGRKGRNNLIFESNGEKSAFGVFAEGFGINSVSVRPFGSLHNILQNHEFDQPRIVGFDYGMFTDKIPGWISTQVFIAVGHYFGADWGWTQVIQLNGDKENAKIMQEIKINDNWVVSL